MSHFKLAEKEIKLFIRSMKAYKDKLEANFSDLNYLPKSAKLDV